MFVLAGRVCPQASQTCCDKSLLLQSPYPWMLTFIFIHLGWFHFQCFFSGRSCIKKLNSQISSMMGITTTPIQCDDYITSTRTPGSGMLGLSYKTTVFRWRWSFVFTSPFLFKKPTSPICYEKASSIPMLCVYVFSSASKCTCTGSTSVFIKHPKKLTLSSADPSFLLISFFFPSRISIMMSSEQAYLPLASSKLYFFGFLCSFYQLIFRQIFQIVSGS